MKKLPYTDVIREIETRHSSVWLAKFSDGSQRLLVLSKEFTIPGVVEFLRSHGKINGWPDEFRVVPVDVGIFLLDRDKGIHNMYLPDARYLDQDMNVVSDIGADAEI